MPLLTPIHESELESPTFSLPHQLPESEPTREDTKAGVENITEKDEKDEDGKEEEEEEFDPTHGFSIDGPLENIEGPWDYLHGGHHPVQLKDNLGPSKRYRVIHKLGTGGFANVWLCRVLGKKPTEYVAVKILMAELSGGRSRELEYVHRLQELAKIDPLIEKYCLLPLDIFEIDGPNGRHQCFVYPIAGQTVKMIDGDVDDPHEYLRDLARQAAEAMGALHRHGLCHGDFRPGNILLRADWLNGMSEEEVLNFFDQPIVTNVIARENAARNACVPPYIVYPIEYWSDRTGRLSEQIASNRICIIDFGEAFDEDSPPPGGVGIPYHYASPDLVLEDFCSTASDVYALAATMYEIRMGKKLFEVYENGLAAYLYYMVDDRGPLPEDWWRDWVEKWKEAHAELEGGPIPELTEGEEVVRRRHIQEWTKMGVGHLLNDGWHEKIPEDERLLFEDLLFEMTWHEPPQRISMEEVLAHPWFSYKPLGNEYESDDMTDVEPVKLEASVDGPEDMDTVPDNVIPHEEDAYQQEDKHVSRFSDTTQSTLPVPSGPEHDKTIWFEAPEYQSAAATKRKMADVEKEGTAKAGYYKFIAAFSMLRKSARAVKAVFQ
ncbi:kinase-like domain-containing protein [Aspergillus unguis]